MANQLHVSVYPNPYRGYEARFAWNGMLHRYSFELRTELAIRLVDDSVEQAVIDAVMDSLDNLEWGSRPQYPLGVSDLLVEEPTECDCAAQSKFWDLRIDNARLWWMFQGAKTVIGLLAATIAFLVWSQWS